MLAGATFRATEAPPQLPGIDKLAGEGIRFNNYTVESQCTPTRIAILTGRQSVRCGTSMVV
jgi:arylsulfatase A-like enzyme